MNKTIMNNYIDNIHINKLYHLEDFDIPIADKKYPHLIITGKNGSGKTVLLDALADYLQYYHNQKAINLLELLEDPNRPIVVHFNLNTLHEKRTSLQNQDFIIAFYQADRSVKMIEPDSPQKPHIEEKGDIRKTASDQFINFLVDLKFQELLAISNQEKEREQSIKAWFGEFENLLKTIFQKEDLTLTFDQVDKYSFKISTGQQTFGFNEMSDGFKAAINIVADLILKMQNGGKISAAYQKKGIVLIDEIETHLHLGLQKIIMPFLTKTFPNIQFIVTTHSPFVLNSMENAVAYDLEHRKPIEDLSNNSYEALAEGYFGVSTESSTVEIRLNRLKELLEQKERTDADNNEIRLLITELDKVSEAVSPDLVGEYINLKLNHVNIIKEIGK